MKKKLKSKKRKVKALSDEEIKLIMYQISAFEGLLLAEWITRSMWGKGLLQSFKDMYGKKWEAEGYVFDERLLREIDKLWEKHHKLKGK